MIEDRDRLERVFELFEMPEPALERLVHRRQRIRRTQRVVAGVTALVISALAIGVLIRAYGPARVPADADRSPSPVVEVGPAIPIGFRGSWNGPWPEMTQTEMEEAQAQADSGDPDLAWQVDLNEDGLVAERFVRDALGWAGGRISGVNYLPRTSESALEAGIVEWHVIRCGSGANPLYPGVDCSPTIDATHYQQVLVRAEQLVTRGRGGLWFVMDVRKVAPYEQGVPRTEPQARSLMTTFLDARVAGSGAEQLVDCCQHYKEVKLSLYETSGGSPFVSYELTPLGADAEWPLGNRRFRVTMYAEDGTRVVETPYRVGPRGDDVVVGCCYFTIREVAS